MTSDPKPPTDQKYKMVIKSTIGRLPTRWVAAALLLSTLVLVAWVTGASDHLQRDVLLAHVDAAGHWGVLLFVCAFALGLLVQVPGVLFVGVALLAWGDLNGALVALGGALFALSISFFVVRLVGGSGKSEITPPRLIERALEQLDRHPIKVVALLRLVAFLSPPVNYLLALSSVRYRDYLVGSVLGLLLPFLALSVFSECLLSSL